MNKDWVKGCPGPYTSVLNKMSPEEREIHLAERKVRKMERKIMKTMQEKMTELIQAQDYGWLAQFNNALAIQLKKAIDEGDTQAFKAAWEVAIGKPGTNVDVTSNGNTIQAPTIIFTAAELDEWKDEKED